MMKNPVAYFTPVAEDVLIHGLPILVETDRAVKAMKDDDYYTYGLNIGKILNNATGYRQEWQPSYTLDENLTEKWELRLPLDFFPPL